MNPAARCLKAVLLHNCVHIAGVRTMYINTKKVSHIHLLLKCTNRGNKGHKCNCTYTSKTSFFFLIYLNMHKSTYWCCVGFIPCQYVDQALRTISLMHFRTTSTDPTECTPDLEVFRSKMRGENKIKNI